MKTSHLLASVLLVIVLGACGSSSGPKPSLAANLPASASMKPASPFSTAPSSTPTAVRPTTETTAIEPPASTAAPTFQTVCEAFAAFWSDITTYTPHDTARLIPDAQVVDQIAHTTGQHVAQADDLVAYVSAVDFPQNGNVEGPPVQALYNACP